MKYRAFTLLLLIFSSVQVFSQDISLPELQGYKRISNYPVYTSDNLWDFINGAADAYLALGFENLHVAEYKKGNNLIKLEIYKHKDNTRTFGIYASERSPSFRYLNLGSQGYKTDGSLNFFKGRYYVKIRTYSKSEKILQLLETLAIKVSEMLPGEPVMPKTLSDFPENGKKKNEETYISESVLGHEFLQGAFKALYTLGDQEISVFIMDKNSPEESRKSVSAFLVKAGLEIDDPAGGRYVFKDGYNGNIFLAWKDTRIVIISGLEKDQSDVADRFTSEILK
jgi:hypothetical protein